MEQIKKALIRSVLCFVFCCTLMLALKIPVYAAATKTGDYTADSGGDYRYWSQGTSVYSGVREVGCWIVAMSKLIYETTDRSATFNPDRMAEWLDNNGYIPNLETDLNYSGYYYNAAPQYAKEKWPNGEKSITYIETKKNPSNEDIWRYINAGQYTVLQVNGWHYVYVDNELSKSKGAIYVDDSYSDNYAPGPVLLSNKYGTVNQAQVYAAKIDTTPPELSQEGKVKITGSYGGSTSSETTRGYRFNLSFTVTDNCGIDHISVLQREFGQDDSKLVSVYEISCSNNNTHTKKHDVECTLTAPEGIYYYKIVATDEDGNSTTQWLNNTANLYEVSTSDAGTYKVIADKAILHVAPWAKVNGKSTNTGVSALKDTKLDVIGSYTNPDNGHVWYQVGNERWIYSERVKKCNWFSNFLDGLFSLFGSSSQGGYSVERVVYTNGQIADPSSDNDSKATINYRFIDNAPDEVTTVDDNGNADAPAGFYKVSFDANGGISSCSLKYVEEGSAYGTLPTASRSGYNFAGWQTAPNGGGEISAGDICDKDITLYAQWVEQVKCSGSCGENLTYTLRSDGTLVIKGYGEMTSAPWYSDGYNSYILDVSLPEGLTSICSNAFERSKIYEIDFPESLQRIEDNAFDSCKSLIEVTIPSDIILGQDSFKDCIYLKKLILPVDYIFTTRPFYNCSKLATIEYTPGKTGKMADFAQSSEAPNYYENRPEFHYNSGDPSGTGALKTIILDEGVTRIGAYAFKGEGSSSYEITNVILPSTLEEIGEKAFYYQRKVNPSLTNGTKLTKLGASCFSRCEGISAENIQRLIRDVDEVPENCFSYCTGLTELTVPSNITLGEDAFNECSSLERLTLPVDYIFTTDPFSECSKLATIEYTRGETGIMADVSQTSESDNYYANRPEDKFNNRNALKNVIFDEGVKRIGAYAFCNNGTYGYADNLTNIILPSTLEEIGENAFYYQTEINPSIKEGTKITKLGTACFIGCRSLSSETIARLMQDVEEIPVECFESCTGLKELTVKSDYVLGQDAFNGCSALEKLTLPVDYIFTTRPFNGCSKLSTIEYTPGKTGKMADVSQTPETDNYYSYRPEYRYNICNSSYETSLANVIFDEGVTRIGAYAFCGDGSSYTHVGELTSVTLPSTLEEIGEKAFHYQPKINPSIKEGTKITKLGTACFKDCRSLSSETIARLMQDVEEIPVECFESCTGLKELTVKSDYVLGQDAFNGCSALEKLTLPVDYVFTTRPFHDCSKLATIEYTPGKTGEMADVNTTDSQADNYRANRPEYRYNNCDSSNNGALKTIIFDEGVTRIGAYAFCGSGNSSYREVELLTNISLPSTLEEIGEKAFYYQTLLEEITLPENLLQIGNSAFANCNGLKDIVILQKTTSIGSSAIPSGSSLTVYGVKESYAETFAETNQNKFIALNYPYIESEHLEMVAGESQKLTSTVYTGIHETTDEVVWNISGNADEATTIDESGVLQVAKGETAKTITVSATYGENTNRIQMQITSLTKQDQQFEGTQEYQKKYGDDSFTLDVSLKAGDGTLTYASSDINVADVDETGVVSIKGAGNTIITVTASETEDYQKTSYDINISVAKSERMVSAAISKNELMVGETAVITADEGAMFNSSDETVATVDETGIVSAVSVGSADIEIILPETSNELECKTTIGISVVEKPHQHILEAIDEVPATCEESGTKAYWKCSECGCMFSDEKGTMSIDTPVVINAKGHDYGEWTADGESGHSHICANDAAHTESEPHSFSNWVTTKEATYEQAGMKKHVCADCGFEEQEEIPKLEKSADQIAAESAEAVINSLPTTISTSDEGAIQEARAAYNSLSEDQKKLIPTEVVNKLTQAESKITTLKEAAKQETGSTTPAAAPATTPSSAPATGTATSGPAVGTAVNVAGQTVTVTSQATVIFTKAANKKAVTVPETMIINGKKYTVTGIAAKAFTGKKIKTVTVGKSITTISKNAFAKSKVTKLIIKTKNLSKKSVKGALKGSKVKTVQVKVGNKKVNKKFVKTYKKIFTKKNAGKKVTLK